MSTQNDTRNMAVFCDFENVALGVREAKYERFDMKKVLERLLVKGSIVVLVASYRLGAGWTSDGPGSGYFPFYIGLIISVSAAIHPRDWPVSRSVLSSSY